MYRLPLLVGLLIILNGCKNESKTYKSEEQDKIIKTNEFETSEALKLNEMGIEYGRRGNNVKANEYFLEALEIEPNNPAILSNLGLNWYIVYDYEKAIDYYNQSLKASDSTYHTAAVNLGLTYFYNKQFHRGLDILNYVIEQTDDKEILSTAYVHRALNYLGKNECDKAEDDLNYIIDNFRSIGNTDFHIKDLSEKIKSCFENVP